MFNRNSKKNTRFAIYAGNPGFSGMVICSDFIGYVNPPTTEVMGFLPLLWVAAF